MAAPSNCLAISPSDPITERLPPWGDRQTATDANRKSQTAKVMRDHGSFLVIMTVVIVMSGLRVLLFDFFDFGQGRL
jgi:hypothetical protein